MSDVGAQSYPQTPSRRPLAVKLLGWLCILFGLPILGGGVWLILLGGSWYYGFAGAGLIATGVLLHRYSVAAVWVYLAVWLGTLAWAWWEVGADWWAQVPRLVAPTLFLVLVLLCLPVLRRRSTGF
jgi:glucose dehydrogenase